MGIFGRIFRKKKDSEVDSQTSKVNKSANLVKSSGSGMSSQHQKMMQSLDYGSEDKGGNKVFKKISKNNKTKKIGSKVSSRKSENLQNKSSSKTVNKKKPINKKSKNVTLLSKKLISKPSSKITKKIKKIKEIKPNEISLEKDFENNDFNDVSSRFKKNKQKNNGSLPTEKVEKTGPVCTVKFSKGISKEINKERDFIKKSLDDSLKKKFPKLNVTMLDPNDYQGSDNNIKNKKQQQNSKNGSIKKQLQLELSKDKKHFEGDDDENQEDQDLDQGQQDESLDLDLSIHDKKNKVKANRINKKGSASEGSEDKKGKTFVSTIKQQIEAELGVGKKHLKQEHLRNTNDYVRTGIEGFDSLLESGIPKGAAVLLAGGAGSGKTIFALQTLYNHAVNGKKCLYMSFEESEERLVNHMRDFGWDAEKLIRKKNLVIKRFNPFEITRSVDALLMKSKGELLIDVKPVIFPEGFKPEIIVVDSLSAIASAFTGKEDSYRIYIEQLFRFFEEIGATSFLITETKQVPTIFSTTGVEEFLADAVIVLYNIKRGNSRERAIEILKLRGAAHRTEIVALNITSNGLNVYPEQEVFGGLEETQ